MHRSTAALFLVAGVLATSGQPGLSEESATGEGQSPSNLMDQTTLPNAIELKGPRPKADPSVLPPAATTLPEGQDDLAAPPSLALPDSPEQVRIRELRPLTIDEALQIVEVNSPTLKAAESQVEQAKSNLRAAISAWYPTVDFQANGFPEYFKSYRYRTPEFTRRTVTTGGGNLIDTLNKNPFFQNNPIDSSQRTRTRQGQYKFYGREWQANVALAVEWNIIDPARVPQIAAARDQFEQSRDAYLIALRDLRLNASEGLSLSIKPSIKLSVSRRTRFSSCDLIAQDANSRKSIELSFKILTLSCLLSIFILLKILSTASIGPSKICKYNSSPQIRSPVTPILGLFFREIFKI